ncbi:MAG TPA: aldo/keto reductase [Chthoniobacter sp.]|jgi:diketogulonate reductase-like aldo/keto reductase
MPAEVRTLPLLTGRRIPILGQGTWGMGESAAKRAGEIAALRLGLDLGMTLIDTAEMYGEGGAEEVIGEAIAGRREEAFLVSKVYPHNATRQGAVEACERSLRRLGTDYLDVYLLHWRGAVPLAETLAAFQALRAAGKIRDCGVSNLDLDDLTEARDLPGGQAMVTNQVLYNLTHRGIEWDLLPWCQERGIVTMAYCPIDQPTGHTGRRSPLLTHGVAQEAARRHGATPAQIALAWLLQRDVVAIPKASQPKHVRENRRAAELRLAAEDLQELDEAFPPPRRKQPLAMR